MFTFSLLLDVRRTTTKVTHLSKVWRGALCGQGLAAMCSNAMADAMKQGLQGRKMILTIHLLTHTHQYHNNYFIVYHWWTQHFVLNKSLSTTMLLFSQTSRNNDDDTMGMVAITQSQSSVSEPALVLANTAG